MEINCTKCESIYFGSNNSLLTYNFFGNTIPVVDSFKDLGLVVDSDLKFRQHVHSVRTKALKLIGFLFKTFHSKHHLYT